MVTGDNIITATAIAKESNILIDEGKEPDIDLSNLKPTDMEMEPNLDPQDPQYNEKMEAHVKDVIRDQPKALLGNTFFRAIHGLYCGSCKKDTKSCKCAKTQAEADKKKEEAKNRGQKIDVPVLDETIREEDMPTFKALVKNLRVMARSQPIHKYALVLGLKKLNLVVGVTGKNIFYILLLI